MNPDTTLPADWKPLREAASAFTNRMIDVAPSSLMTIRPAVFADGMHAIWMVLLADLSKPGPRDFWARWLAEKVGLTVGATAPTWVQFGDTAWMLTAWTDEQCVMFGEGESLRRAIRPDRAFVVPGIYTITDPAAALRAAILAVVPA